LSKTLDLNPNFRKANYNLSLCLYKTGNFDK